MPRARTKVVLARYDGGCLFRRRSAAHTWAMPDEAAWAEPVVVPDDLRSLQADIEAYHRERRLAQRRRRLHRITGSRLWRRVGMPLTVLAGALALAGTVFAALMLGQPGAQPAPMAAPLAADPAGTVGAAGGLLPDTTVMTAERSVSIRELRPALVVLVPIGCACTDALSDLAAQADEVRIPLVAVAPQLQDAEIAALPGQLHRGRVQPVFDTDGELAATYGAEALTVLGVAVDGTVRFVLKENAPELERLELALHGLLTSTPPRAG